MSLLNRNFMTVGGEPITGRTPTQILVYGDAQSLTGDQRNLVEHAYKLFYDAVRLSAAASGFHVQNRILSDGTRIRMESNSGIERVMVWPVTGDEDYETFFFSVPSTYTTLSFTEKPSAVWKFRKATAPPKTLESTRVINPAANDGQHPGYLTWYSDKIKFRGRPVTVSWTGRPTRYGRYTYVNSAGRQNFLTTTDFNKIYGESPYVWIDGIRRSILLASDSSAINVSSAALRHVKEEGKNYLYVVSSGAIPAVYRGAVADLHDSGQVLVTKLFDVGFKVGAGIADTSYFNASGIYDGVVQPFYFNESCTFASGLVVVVKGDSGNPNVLNPDAAAALPTYSNLLMPPRQCGSTLLATIDIEAGAIAYTREHVKDIYEISASLTSTPAAVGTVNASADYSGTDGFSYNKVRYGAVDYVKDKLQICLIDIKSSLVNSRAWTYENVRTLTDNDTGPAGSGTDGGGSFVSTYTTQEVRNTTNRSETSSGVARSSYRVYIVDGKTLGEQDFGPVTTGAYINSSVAHTNYDEYLIRKDYAGGAVVYLTNPLPPGGTSRINWDAGGTYNCTHSEIMGADALVLTDAFVEGGDIRHEFVVVQEILEGHATSIVTTTQETVVDTSNSLFSWSDRTWTGKENATTPSVKTGTASRAFGNRLVAWMQGSKCADGGSDFETMTQYATDSAGYTLFSCIDANMIAGIGASNGGAKHAPEGLATPQTWTTLGGDYFVLRYPYSIYAKTFQMGNIVQTNWQNSTGFMASNASAISPDGKFGALSLVSIKDTNPLCVYPFAAPLFYLNGAWKNAWQFLPKGDSSAAPARLSLNAPIFIYNVAVKK